MKKLIVLLIFVINCNFVFADTGERYHEPAGNFSICPPLNWLIMEYPGLKYRIFITEQLSGFSPNMNFVDEKYTGSMSQYIELSLANLKVVFPDILLIRNETFTANNGTRGAKLTVNNESFGYFLRLFIYIFPYGGTMYVITCSVTDNAYLQFEPLFDESAKTFMVE